MKWVENETGCPGDYTEFYEAYFEGDHSFVRRELLTMGCAYDEIEDVVQSLFVKAMQKDLLSWYDPTKLHDVGLHPRLPGPRLRPSKFQPLLKRFIQTYGRQPIDKQRVKVRREALYDEMPEPRFPYQDQRHHETWDAIASAKQLHAARVSEIVWRASVEIEALADEDVDGRQRLVWEARRRAQLEIEEATRRDQALEVALRLAADGVRVTGAAIAREMGWSPAKGAAALRGAREDLRGALG